MKRFFTPNEVVSSWDVNIIIGGWIAAWLLAWGIFRPAIFPSPLDVVNAFPDLWLQDGLGQELITSFLVSLQALALSTAISLPLAYASRTPVMRPIAQYLAGLRFLSPAVFFLVLLFLAGSGHAVKVLMLAMGETFFLVTTMMGVVDGVSQDDLDDARTLNMSEWRVTWYVIVRGTLDQAIAAVRDNAAMGWAMLTMVEGIVRSEGGVGVLILNNEKHFNFAAVYAIATAVTVVGLCQDYAIGFVRLAVCPWAVRA